MTSRVQFLVAAAIVALAVFSPREVHAQCPTQCLYVCCSAGDRCAPDGMGCLAACEEGQTECPSGGCCPQGTTCGEISGTCEEDPGAPPPVCEGEFPVECGNGNCCGASFPVCCPYTCCPLGTTCSANGFSCIGEPSISCAADRDLTLVACELAKPYCECARECADDDDCATGCCRGGVCSHPCLCKEESGSSAVTPNVDPSQCPVPSFSESPTGGLGRGGCVVGTASPATPAALLALLVVLVGWRRARRRTEASGSGEQPRR